MVMDEIPEERFVTDEAVLDSLIHPNGAETSGKKLPRTLGSLGFLIGGLAAACFLLSHSPSQPLEEASPMDVETFNELEPEDKLIEIFKYVEKHVPFPSPHSKMFQSEKSPGPEGTDWARQLEESTRQLEEISPRRGLEITQCSFDIYQIVITIGQIVCSIEGLKQACEQPYPVDNERRTTCAGLVMLQIGFYGFIYTYITDAVSSCPGKFSLHAGCALNIGGLITGAIKIGGAGAQMAGNCNQGIPPPGDAPINPQTDLNSTARAQIKPETLERLQRLFDEFQERLQERPIMGQAWALGGGRRLNGTDEDIEGRRLETLPGDPLALRQAIDAKAVEDHHFDNKMKKWAKAACAMDTQNLVIKMGVVGVAIGFSAMDCKQEYFKERGHPGKNKCAIDIGLIMGNLGIAGVMVSLDVINCPATLEYNPDALCGGAIADLIGQVGFMETVFAGVQDTCGSLDPNPPGAKNP